MMSKEKLRQSVWEEVNKLTSEDIKEINKEIKLSKRKKTILDELGYLNYVDEISKSRIDSDNSYTENITSNITKNAEFETQEEMKYSVHVNSSSSKEIKNINVAA